MKRDRASVSRRAQRGWQRSGVVHDHQIAWAQEVGQVAEPRMDDTVIVGVADQQTHLVTAEAARLRWLAGFQLRRQREIQQAFGRDHVGVAPVPAGSSFCASNRPKGADSP
jgi:hypothetical protein